MFARNKAFMAFDCSQQPLAFVRINCMLNILLMRQQLQVVEAIVGAVKVFVVNFKAPRNGAIERLPHQTMNSFFGVLAFAAQIYYQVMRTIWTRRHCSICCVAAPCFTQLDAVRSRDADAQKLSNFFQRSVLFKHSFGFWNFGRVYGFAPRYAAHVPVIANFVQVFKPKNWFPRFHALTPFKVNGV